MEETFFETLERTHFVDTLLLWAALLGPLLILGVAWALRKHETVTSYRRRWALAAMAAPVVWLLWLIFNAVMDHYGLDSVFGFAVSAVIFLVAALLMVAAADLLEGLLAGPTIESNVVEQKPAPTNPDETPPAGTIPPL